MFSFLAESETLRPEPALKTPKDFILLTSLRTRPLNVTYQHRVYCDQK